METNKEFKKAYYDVIVEIITPITIKYRVFAVDEKEAAELVEKGRVSPVFVSKPKIAPNRIRSIAVYIAGTVMKLLSVHK
jgi:hypothetical protein